MVELVPALLRQELARLAEDGQRLDGRGQWEARDVTLETNCLYNAEGSAKVVLGGTVVYAGVKFELRTPWPDRPTQGSLMWVLSSDLWQVGNTNLAHHLPNPLNWVVWWTVESVNPAALTWRVCALFRAKRSGAS